jgi:SAM-dependent methyltransferase
VTSWRDFWNRDTPIYAGERHKILHYRLLARDIAALIPSPEATVLDHGSGEALSADRVAAKCRLLYLCDAAPLVRERLTERFRDYPRIAVIAPEELEDLDDESLDLVVANSLVQYLSLEELRSCLGLWRDKLKRDGRLVLADVIPHDLGALTDARALLAFAWKGGFIRRAALGLAHTALSDYRRLRNELGLARYDEGEMIDILRSSGFSAERRRPNLGHNQARMTFVARPAP